MNRFLLSKLRSRRIWSRIFEERIADSLVLNLASIGVAIAGNFRNNNKVKYDLVIRSYHAWGLLQAADFAKTCGVSKITAIEFGVANGAGLMNLAHIAPRVTRATGVEIQVVGFDTGMGMPPPRDYRDHPEHYRVGDYPTTNPDWLTEALPTHASIIWGEISETLPEFLAQNPSSIGFVSFDVDYYWSTVEALKVLDGSADIYAPWVVLYFDDIQYVQHNEFAGQLLAI